MVNTRNGVTHSFQPVKLKSIKRCVKVGIPGCRNGRDNRGCAKVYNLICIDIRDAGFASVDFMQQVLWRNRGTIRRKLERPREAKSDKHLGMVRAND